MACQSRIILRRRRSPREIVSKRDFLTWGSREVSLKELSADRLSPYAIDFKRGEVTFVTCSSAIDLASAHPFFYEAQRQHAESVVVASFDEVEASAAELELPAHRLSFLYSVGRSGSTIAGKLAGQLPGVQQVSEPDFYSQLAFEPSAFSAQGRPRVVRLLRALTRWFVRHRLASAPSCPTILVKQRGAALYAAELIRAAAPESSAMFLHRNAADVIDSYVSAFLRNPFVTLARKMRLDRLVVRALRSLLFLVPAAVRQHMPLVVEPGVRDRNSHGIVEIMAIGFHSMMAEAARLAESRRLAFASVLRYEDLASAPEVFVRHLIAGLGIEVSPGEQARALLVLKKNSQAGSPIASTGRRALSEREQRQIEATLAQLNGPFLPLGGAS